MPEKVLCVRLAWNDKDMPFLERPGFKEHGEFSGAHLHSQSHCCDQAQVGASIYGSMWQILTVLTELSVHLLDTL